MKIKKSILSFLLNFVIIAAFTVICFLLRTEYTTCFYCSFGFTVFAFLMYVLSTHIIPKKKEYVILGYAPIVVSTVYFAIAAVLNFCFILFKMENLTVNLVVNIAVAAIYLVMFLFNLYANEAIMSDGNAHKTELKNYYEIKDVVLTLKGCGRSLFINKRLESLCDAAESAQIYRNGSELESLDRDIEINAMVLKSLLDLGNCRDDEILKEIDSLAKLIDNRNKIIEKSAR